MKGQEYDDESYDENFLIRDLTRYKLTQIKKRLSLSRFTWRKMILKTYRIAQEKRLKFI